MPSTPNRPNNKRSAASAEKVPLKKGRTEDEGLDEEADPNASVMPPATLDEFFQFLQCQLRKESQVHLKKAPKLVDPGTLAMADEYEAFVKPNLGGNERWVPFHTVLGKHEKFLVEAVHHSKHGWDEKQRFQAIFIFRAHCKCDLFTTAQLPMMLKPEFWKDLKATFAVDGPMEKALLDYRHTTRKPLLTICFRMIPDRLLEDDDANLVRNIILRTQKLLELSESIWPILKHDVKTAAQKFEGISTIIQNEVGLGETWAKMLTVCLDLAYPSLGLLASQCDVGVGAITPLRRLLPGGGPADHQEALEALRKEFNTATSASAKHFWDILAEVEASERKHFEKFALIVEQTSIKRGELPAVTLQVQLCEYRQYRHALARNKYELDGDASMKEMEKEKKLRPEQMLKRDTEENVVLFDVAPKQDGLEKTVFKVSVDAAAGKWRVAERIAVMCYTKITNGGDEASTATWRDELCQNCLPGVEDVPDDHPSWEVCRVNLSHPSPLVSFHYTTKGGSKVAFQTTVKASGGAMEAERLARLCWAKFEAGAEKDQVLEYRAKLYAQRAAESGQPLQKSLRPVPKPQPGMLQQMFKTKQAQGTPAATPQPAPAAAAQGGAAAQQQPAPVTPQPSATQPQSQQATPPAQKRPVPQMTSKQLQEHVASESKKRKVTAALRLSLATAIIHAPLTT